MEDYIETQIKLEDLKALRASLLAQLEKVEKEIFNLEE
jgi:hypothetical protein